MISHRSYKIGRQYTTPLNNFQADKSFQCVGYRALPLFFLGLPEIFSTLINVRACACVPHSYPILPRDWSSRIMAVFRLR